MSTDIEKNQEAILKYLYQIDKKSDSKIRATGNDIKKFTNLKPNEINDAIRFLHDADLIHWFTAMGTAPYRFVSVKINHRGKLDFQKKETIMNKSEKQISIQVDDPRKVFVVHGRNMKARDAIFNFLHSIDLRPMEWSELVRETGKGAPYIGEVLDKAFSKAQAVVVLMTPDDEGRLRKSLVKQDDPAHEIDITPQARQNVLFEAGMSMGRFPKRTILVELGTIRPFSDIGGRHTIKFDGSTQKRQELAQRLETAGCPVNLMERHWHTAGDFKSSSIQDITDFKKNERANIKNQAIKKEKSTDNLRIIDKIYVPLYNEVDYFLSKTDRFTKHSDSKYQLIRRQSKLWLDLIEKDLQKNIKLFYTKIKEFNSRLAHSAIIIQKIVAENISIYFNVPLRPTLSIHIDLDTDDGGQVSPTINQILIRKTTPELYFETQETVKKITKIKYRVDNPSHPLKNIDAETFNNFFKEVRYLVESNGDIIDMRELEEQLRTYGKELKNKLIQLCAE